MPATRTSPVSQCGIAYEKTPEADADCCSRVFFCWPSSIFLRGSSTVLNAKGEKVPYHLQQIDMFPLREGDGAGNLVKEFETMFAEQSKVNKERAVYNTLKAMFWGEFIWVGVYKFLNSTLQFLPSIILNLFLQRLEMLTDSSVAQQPGVWEAYVIGASLFFALSIRTLTENAYFHSGTRVAFNVRSTLTTAVYRKALRLSPAARQGTKEGSIVQLMNVDAERFNAAVPMLHNLWDGIYQIIGYMVLLTVYIGPSSFAGLATMLLLIPINLCMHGRMMGLRRSISKLTDDRVQATNEALQGVRAIKLYGWEAAFERNIAGIREKELEKVNDAAKTNAFVFTFMQSAPVIVSVVTLTVYASVSETFSVSTVFTAMTILTQLRFPLMFYPMVIFLTSAASVSLARIEKFMGAPEVSGDIDEDGYHTHRGTAGSGATPTTRGSSAALVEASALKLPEDARATSRIGLELATRPETAVAVHGGRFWWCDPEKPVVDLLGGKEAASKRKAKEAAKKAKEAADKAAEGAAASADSSSADTPSPAGVESPAADADEEEGAGKMIASVPILDDVFFGVPEGQLLAVVGAVGSGKTALCSAMLGELYKESGRVIIDGSVAYCAQRSWILNATVQKNIIFAEEYNEERYKAVIKACQLEDDLLQLPAGDQTEIGERGVNLSGGQKQRVSVARACYSNSDVVILDDVLSALDPEVGARLFEQCVLGRMGGRTRIMVTNQIHVLEHCDLILELEQEEDGTARVARLGTFSELMDDSIFRERIEEYAASAAAKHEQNKADAKAKAESDEAAAAATAAVGVAASGSDSVPGSPKPAASAKDEGAVLAGATAAGAGDDSKASPPAALAKVTATAATASPPGTAGGGGGASPSAALPAQAGKTAVAATVAVGKDGGKLIAAETKEQGAVQLRYYIAWLRAGSGSLWVLTGIWLVFVSMVNQFGMLASNFWVSFWASDPLYVNFTLGEYMGAFAGIGVGSAVLSMFRLIFFVYAGLSASRHMHADLFHSVIYAPMAFFDTTPLGRVMARFSKDVDAVDFNLASQIGNLAMTVFLIIGSILSIVYATPWFGVAVIPIFVVYWGIASYFRNVSRECKRIDSVTRSPIYAHFGETLGGLSTIRAYGQSTRFADLNEVYVNTNTSAFYTLRSCDRWLSVRLEILGNTIVLLSAILAAASAEADSAAGRTTASGTVGIAALAGFALSFSLTITSVMSWAVRTLAETENMMNSVERIVVTTEETPQEPQERRASAPEVSESWASRGQIAFKSVKMRYRDDAPEVLHGVDFTVKPGEKVGIVGRSGSGKSSIMQVLFRIPVDGCVAGKVEVDGVDTKSVSLHTLRHRLSIIPQESVMFSGKLRDNLDPAGEVRDRAKADGIDADELMMRALKDVGLDDTVEKKGGLEATVAEFGENWSAGERQLLSLARVLLRDTKILCLDEVSSSVDSETDKRMHETIQARFADRTVLTIAHRLHTVIGSDRVLVMHAGVVVEFDHPHTLLSDPDSRFSSLVADTGAAAEGLRELARQSWIDSHPGEAAAVDVSDVATA